MWEESVPNSSVWRVRQTFYWCFFLTNKQLVFSILITNSRFDPHITSYSTERTISKEDCMRSFWVATSFPSVDEVMPLNYDPWMRLSSQWCNGTNIPKNRVFRRKYMSIDFDWFSYFLPWVTLEQSLTKMTVIGNKYEYRNWRASEHDYHNSS